MLCPRWAWTRTQPIALRDVVRLIRYCLETRDLAPGAYDVGAPDVTTYRDLMMECARLMGLKRHFFYAPLFAPKLSTLWVCLVTGASRRLVSPLVASMSHAMTVRDRRLMDASGLSLMGYQEALRSCIGEANASLGRQTRKRKKSRKQERDVRSIQRLRVAAGWSARDIGQEYFDWVSRAIRPWIQVVWTVPGQVRFVFRLFSARLTLLELRRQAGALQSGVESFEIVGGVLLSPKREAQESFGRLEFRAAQSPSYAMVGLHGFRPRLPWIIYKFSQALLHRALTIRFAKWMAARPPRGLT